MRKVVFLPFVLWLGSTLTAQAQPYDEAPNVLKVMTWNVEWMFDPYSGDNRSKLSKEKSAPQAYWDAKLSGISQAIASVRPNIIALQEIEGDQTLRSIADDLRSKHGMSYRYAFVQGTDSFTEQDVGILMNSGLIAYGRQEQSKTMFDSQQYYNMSKHIVAQFRWSNVQRPLTILNVHFRARKEAEDKRVKQAKLARVWLESPLADGHDVILLGDLNSEYEAGELKGDIAAIAGTAGKPAMLDLLAQSRNPKMPTHLILNRQFDRILASESLVANESGKDWVFDSIEVLPQLAVVGRQDGEEHWDEPTTLRPDELDLSDHAPVVATFRLK